MAQKKSKTGSSNMKRDSFAQKTMKKKVSDTPTKFVKSTTSSLDYDDDDTLVSKLNLINKMTAKDKSLWKQFGKFLLPIVYSLVAIIVIAILKNIILAPSRSEIATQKNDIKKLNETYDLLANEVQSGTIAQQIEDTYNSQIYNGGVDSNDALIQEFFQKYLNWQSGAQYETLRAEIQQYLATADGQPMYTDRNSFVQCFLPRQDETYDDAKHRIYEIDAEKTQLEYKGSYLYRLSNTSNSATYASVVVIHITSSNTDFTGIDRAVYVTFTVKNGKLYNLNASPIQNSI